MQRKYVRVFINTEASLMPFISSFLKLYHSLKHSLLGSVRINFLILNTHLITNSI